jgi:hypothetical protein
VARWASVGGVQDRIDDVAGYIRAENRAEWAASGDDDRVIANAVRARTGKLLAHMKRRLAEAAAAAAP